MMDGTYMYLVVNGALGMSSGKIAAQCGHAVQQLMTAYYEQRNVPAYEERLNGFMEVRAFEHWLRDPAKVVLIAQDEEWAGLHSMLERKVLIVDEGRTEVQPDSQTVIGFWPMYKSKQPYQLKRLQLLKDQTKLSPQD